MYKVIGVTKLNYFEFLTILINITTLTNIQNVINSISLTYRTNTNDLEIIVAIHF